MKRSLWCLGVVVLAAALFFVLGGDALVRRAQAPAPAQGAVPLGVLGDSDSHAYHDELAFGHSETARGGVFRPYTWQWTEVLARLRPQALDMGPWGRWGIKYRRVALLRETLGLDGRFPAKQDYYYNIAYSGSVCAELNERPRDQTAQLLATMAREPQRWHEGIVLIRIGTNDFGKQASLDALSRNPDDPPTVALMANCVRHIGQAVKRLRVVYPGLRIVLVGIFNNAEWARYHSLWRTPQAMQNIYMGLEHFDGGLKSITQGDGRMFFLDDNAWFAGLWGTRRHEGVPSYRDVAFGPRFTVSNSEGDEPRHATLIDGHAGAVWNALWAQALVVQLNAHFGLRIQAIETDELVHFIDRDGRLGMR